jgi:hypothetical protein
MANRFVVPALILFAGLASAQDLNNPLIDYDGFKDNVVLVGALREPRRVTEEEFVRMASDKRTVILDARSSEKFKLLHIKGAKNLSFPDMTADELAKVIPAKDTRILIYCNNNFLNEPNAFPSKALTASLNVHTINALYAYGYTNVFELGPLVDIRESKIKFEGNAQPTS